MTTDAIYKQHGSDWSHQVSAMATTQWLQCDQILPLSVKGVACKTKHCTESESEIVGTRKSFTTLLHLVDFYMTNSISGNPHHQLSSPCPRPSPDSECNGDHDVWQVSGDSVPPFRGLPFSLCWQWYKIGKAPLITCSLIPTSQPPCTQKSGKGHTCINFHISWVSTLCYSYIPYV